TATIFLPFGPISTATRMLLPISPPYPGAITAAVRIDFPWLYCAANTGQHVSATPLASLARLSRKDDALLTGAIIFP
ncbi:MAG: hypothetical protein ACRDHN_19595, partial [Thermomicrobiales bacterium]